MAVSIAQYVDLLFKKLQGVAKTANATVKGASNESIASPAFIRGDVVWTEADQIGNVAQTITGIANSYTGTNAVECVGDTTVPPIGGIRPTWLTNVPYWISQEFGATWLPKVFVGPSGAANIEASGTQIFAAGISGTGEYYFDTQAGVLNFIGETIPSVLTAGNVVYISGYVYSGLLGVTNLPSISITGNISASGNIDATGNVSAGNLISSGAVIGNVTIGGNLTVGNLTVTDYFTGNYIDVSNTISAMGNITGGNLISNADVTTDTVTAAGNISGNNVIINTALSNAVIFTGINSELLTDANLLFDGSNLILSGSANIDNIQIDGTVISSNANLDIATSNDGNLIFTVDGNGIASFVGTTSLTIPVGNTAQRPGTPETGAIRFNTAITQVEVWDGSQWEVVGSDFASITSQQIIGDGSTDTFTLDQSTTSAAVIVATNGVVQQPDVAYTVTGNSITFAEAPQISDIIDVRFTSAVTTVSSITNTAGNAFIEVTAVGIADMSTVHSLQLPTYTVTEANALANVTAGQLIYVSDGDAGNPCLAVYSSGAWKRVSLGANISS